MAATTDDEAANLQQMQSEASSTGSILESYRRDVCISLNLNMFVTFFGTLEEKPHVCNLQSFFDINRNSAYSPVVLHKPNSLYSADIALLPSMKGMDACILHLQFDRMGTRTAFADESDASSSESALMKLSTEEHRKSCFNTPDSFSTNANFPLRSSWSDMQREVFLGADKLAAMGTQTLTRQGVVVVARRIVAQNSLSSIDLTLDSSVSGNEIKMQVY